MKKYDTTCEKCGGLIMVPGKTYGWGGTICLCPDEMGNIPFIHTVPVNQSCTHCYCQVSYKYNEAGKPHKKCCNCGNEQLVTDMGQNIKKFGE